jgi:hypothetical protein
MGYRNNKHFISIKADYFIADFVGNNDIVYIFWIKLSAQRWMGQGNGDNDSSKQKIKNKHT